MTLLQPITDRVTQHLEIISENFQFSTRRIRVLMRFIVYNLVLIVNYLVLIVNPIPWAEFWFVRKVLEFISRWFRDDSGDDFWRCVCCLQPIADRAHVS